MFIPVLQGLGPHPKRQQLVSYLPATIGFHINRYLTGANKFSPAQSTGLGTQRHNFDVGTTFFNTISK